MSFLVSLHWYGAVVKKHVQEITSLISYVVADAFFSQKGFVDQLMEMSLHLVCKLRDDADLQDLNRESPTGKRGRPAKYAGKVDPANPDNEYFQAVENNQGLRAKSAVVYSKSLQISILVVIE